MLIYYHPACLTHETGPGHPERAERLIAVTGALRAAFDDLQWREAPRATRGQLLRVHDERLLQDVLDIELSQPVRLDPDTVLSPGSAEAALRAAGAAVAAVDAVLAGTDTRAFCTVRPPGHHATADTAMGFCLFNNIAIGAAHALEHHGLSRVAIADFDVHHGNGTQAIFAADPRVLYLSAHQMPLYPGTGFANEHGAGNIVDAPLPPGADGNAFRAAWHDILLPALDEFRPQLLLVSAGFDGDARDPLAQWQLSPADYAWLTTALHVLAVRHAGGRIVSTLEGGYDLQALREGSVAHVGGMRDVP